jgi:hypothetical protein
MDRPRGRGKPFAPGNTYGKGRPAGSQNKATLQLQALLDGEGEAIVRKLIEGAKAGEPVLLRLCVERLLARRRERAVQLKVPVEVMTSEDIASTLKAILVAAARGEITLGEAEQIANILEVRRKAIENTELERRMSEFDAQLKALKEARNE